MEGINAAVGRREALKKGLTIGGVGAAAATLGGTAVNLVGASSAGAAENGSLVVDCACLGDTFRMILAQDASGPDDPRGSTFSVEGFMFKAGTIAADGFNPASATPIGLWVCRGWFAPRPDHPGIHLRRDQPRAAVPARPARLQRARGHGRPEPAHHALGGRGGGRYAGASGSVVQRITGTNTTTNRAMGGIPSPNFRFEFKLT